jgi:hypothetical protein
MLSRSIRYKLEGLRLTGRHRLLATHQDHPRHDPGCQRSQKLSRGCRSKAKHKARADWLDLCHGLLAYLNASGVLLLSQSLFRRQRAARSCQREVGLIPFSVKHEASARFDVAWPIILCRRCVTQCPEGKATTASRTPICEIE